MPHYSVIDTRSAPGLWVTLRAITVCAWAQLADAGHAISFSTSVLWRQYQQRRAEDRAWAHLHQAEHLPTGWPVDEQVDASMLDESAIESMARELGRPLWLTGSLLLLVMAGAVVDMLGAWPAVFDAAHRIGAGLASLARS